MLSPGRLKKMSSSAAMGHHGPASPGRVSGAGATGAGGEELQQQQQRASQQSIEFSTSEIKDALRASADESSNDKSPRRTLPAPFTSLMTPRKSSTSSAGASPGRKSATGVVTFNIGGSPDLAHASPRSLGAAAPGSPSSVSPTPAPTPNDAVAAAAAAGAKAAAGTPTSATVASPGASSLWGLLGRKLAVDSPVHEAARQGDLPLIQALMVQDRNVANAPGDGSIYPLMLACGCGHPTLVSYLVNDAKADVGARDLKKRTALHHVALGPAGVDRAVVGPIVDCLLKAKAGAGIVNARDEDGLTPLHHAAVMGRPDLIRALLKHGADARLPVEPPQGQQASDGPVDARRLCEERCHGVPLAKKKEALRLLDEAMAKAEAKGAAEEGAGSLASPSACVHACLSRLCGESGLGAEDEDEIEVVQPVEHQLAPVFRRAGIPAESAELYMNNLRSQGYDNILGLRRLAQDRFSLNKYIADRADRKRITKALEEELGLPIASTELPPLPPAHLPIFEWLLQLLSAPQDTALRYADALRGGLNVFTGQELLNKTFEEVEPHLVGAGILQGHRKAVKVLLKQQQKQGGKK